MVARPPPGTLTGVEKPRLVVSDVDGTLLDPADRISPRVRAVVARVVAAGVPFVLATGRPPRWLEPVVNQLDHAGLAVCANGAVIYDAATDRIRHVAALRPEQLRAAANAVSTALPRVKLAVERIAGSAAEPPSEHFLAEPGYTHPWPGADSSAAPRAELLGKPAIKMMVRMPGTASDAIATAITEVLGDGVDVTFSTGQGLVELSAPNVTKGSGMMLIAHELGIPAADVLAFGDMPNDVRMLEWAGTGIAMANAHPAVLDVADEVTAPNDEDGLAQVLERWF